jgi:hypothetical protein
VVGIWQADHVRGGKCLLKRRCLCARTLQIVGNSCGASGRVVLQVIRAEVVRNGDDRQDWNVISVYFCSPDLMAVAGDGG